MSDIEIAQANEMLPITQVAERLNLQATDLELYGQYKAKITQNKINQLQQQKNGRLILVTSINPTPAGEGKSTVTIGLGDAFTQLEQSVMLALREPSLGPVMGMKGGATGGGYAQVVPMSDINLHFTGDMHALTTAINTLAALIDNHIQQGNVLNIDPRQIIWKRALDINDRALRDIVIGLGGRMQGVPRQDHFEITVASEMMAILCLATDLDDLKKRIAQIMIGYTYDKKPVTVADLKVTGAITMLLKDALKPNLVQTLEHTPALVHGGPFANIAHGCNSILATQTALKLADITITEAGFGADLGAEKFLDIKVPQLGKTPDSIVIVATIRALKYNGGQALAELTTENLEALTAGFVNLKRHIENMQQYQVPVVVAINNFTSDTDAEISCLQSLCEQLGVSAYVTKVWEQGGKGAIDLAQHLLKTLAQENRFKPLYASNLSVEEKITTVVQKIYHGRQVIFEPKAMQQLKQIKKYGWDNLPVCIAKTQYSFSDDAKKLGAPEQFDIHVRELTPKLGAGFIVALTGSVLTMPGLPKQSAALNMDVDSNGKISGLF